jgi:hypothetical protein
MVTSTFADQEIYATQNVSGSRGCQTTCDGFTLSHTSGVNQFAHEEQVSGTKRNCLSHLLGTESIVLQIPPSGSVRGYEETPALPTKSGVREPVT